MCLLSRAAPSPPGKPRQRPPRHTRLGHQSLKTQSLEKLSCGELGPPCRGRLWRDPRFTTLLPTCVGVPPGHRAFAQFLLVFINENRIKPPIIVYVSRSQRSFVHLRVREEPSPAGGTLDAGVPVAAAVSPTWERGLRSNTVGPSPCRKSRHQQKDGWCETSWFGVWLPGLGTSDPTRACTGRSGAGSASGARQTSKDLGWREEVP